MRPANDAPTGDGHWRTTNDEPTADDDWQTVGRRWQTASPDDLPTPDDAPDAGLPPGLSDFEQLPFVSRPTPESNAQLIHVLDIRLTRLRALIDPGLRQTIEQQGRDLRAERARTESLRETLASHMARQDVLNQLIRRALNLGAAATGALILILLSMIGYLLVNPLQLLPT